MRSLLALITLNSLSVVFWGCVGVCRFIHERSRRIRHQAITVALAALLVALIGALLLTLSLGPITWITEVILDHLQYTTPTAARISATVVATWLVLCGAVASYLAARMVDVRNLAGTIIVSGVLYWLALTDLAQNALVMVLAAHGPGTAPLVLLALTTSSCGLGQLLARRRGRLPDTSETPAVLGAPSRITPDDVAVLISAHNEEKSLPLCLDAASKIVVSRNIFVASDGSSDNTVGIAKERGCNVLDIQPNGGKARALQTLIDHFAICDRYAAVLILDADAEVDRHYLEHALPLFDNPAVAAIAGHAIPKWRHHRRPEWTMFFVAYRVRLYRMTQALLRYGQTWKYSNVSFIVPGFASMYRCSVLPGIDIAAKGLIIEDFNMTFDLHHKKLGKIAYTPKVRCTSQEAHNLRDYIKQIRRWYLGFWQTIRLHGVWPSMFWLSMGMFVAEMLLQSVMMLSLPFILAWFLLMPGETMSLWLPTLGMTSLTLADVVIGVFLADYALTLVFCALERKPLMAFYGLGFSVVRVIDAFVYLYTLPLAFFEKSDGRWVSPTRM